MRCGVQYEFARNVAESNKPLAEYQRSINRLSKSWDRNVSFLLQPLQARKQGEMPIQHYGA
jgi:hypothetical protein